MVLTESTNKLKIGDAAPAFKLKGTDGKIREIGGFAGKPLLVVFMCNHCPYVKAKVDEINSIARDFGKIRVVGINSNESENYPEDSFENMILFAKERHLVFPYLHDETQEVARAYGAVCTPDPFLFDSAHRLYYHGRIDDGHGPSAKATTVDLRNAIEALLNSRVPPAAFPSMGCSIKWKR